MENNKHNNNEVMRILSLIERMDKHLTLTEAQEFHPSLADSSYSDDVFDLRKFPKELLERNYVSYSPYRLGISHGSPLQIDNKGNFLNEGISHQADAEEAKNEITRHFPIDISQFVIVKGHHGLIACILVANIHGNIEIITKCMSQYNFFPSRQAPNITILSLNGEEWADIRFEPIEQEDVTDKVRKENQELFHLSPKIFEQSILQNDLYSSNSNPVYKYPTNRLHLIEQRASKDDINRLANDLYQQAVQKGIKNLVPVYTLFKIDLAKVPLAVRFYWDINEEFGLFTPQNIALPAISKMGEITVS